MSKNAPKGKRTRHGSSYQRHSKIEVKYPSRERSVCHCGGILFKGLNDGGILSLPDGNVRSPGAIHRHTHLRGASA